MWTTTCNYDLGIHLFDGSHRYNTIYMAGQRLRIQEYFTAMEEDAAQDNLMIVHVIKQPL